jgi:hypothetical protein
LNLIHIECHLSALNYIYVFAYQWSLFINRMCLIR